VAPFHPEDKVLATALDKPDITKRLKSYGIKQSKKNAEKITCCLSNFGKFLSESIIQ